MRVAYKTYPIDPPDPAFPEFRVRWVPILNVYFYHRHGRSPGFEAVVDSGSEYTLIHASLAELIGLKVESGTAGSLSGVVANAKAEVYYHKIKLAVLAEVIEVTAGFSYDLPVAGILGRIGFFDRFIITFDPTATPPGLDLQRVGRT